MHISICGTRNILESWLFRSTRCFILRYNPLVAKIHYSFEYADFARDCGAGC